VGELAPGASGVNPAQLAGIGPVPDPPCASITIAGVLVGDDQVELVRRDGSLEPVLAGGWPRPGQAHATALRRSGSAAGRGP